MNLLIFKRLITCDVITKPDIQFPALLYDHLVVSLKFTEWPVLIWESAVAASNSVTSRKVHSCMQPDSSLHGASDNILGHYIGMFNSKLK